MYRVIIKNPVTRNKKIYQFNTIKDIFKETTLEEKDLLNKVFCKVQRYKKRGTRYVEDKQFEISESFIKKKIKS